MLAKRAQELEERARKERELHNHLIEHDEANLQIEEEFTNLQEEAAAKTKKVKKLWNIYQSQKGELKDLHEEHQREREDLLETIRQLTNDLKLQNTIINGFIPESEQDLIHQNAEYDEIQEKWRICHIAHAGNNIRGKRAFMAGNAKAGNGSGLSRSQPEEPTWDPMCVFPDVYLSYEVPGLSRKSTKSAGKKSLDEKEKKSNVGSEPIARGLVSKNKRYA